MPSERKPAAIHGPALVQVAVPAPLRRLFDYRLPRGQQVQPGCRVQVPFGRRSLVGVVTAAADSANAGVRLRDLTAVLDAQPVLAPDLLGLGRWACSYYHHPPGEVFLGMLPVALRQGRPADPGGVPGWQLSATGSVTDPASLQRAPRQRAALQLLAAGPQSSSALQAAGISADVLRSLANKDLVERSTLDGAAMAAGGADPAATAAAHTDGADTGLDPTPEQAVAMDSIRAALGSYSCVLLDGVTGSGKTEVYLGAIAAALQRGGQALVLVPEIGLTPQTEARFRERFGNAVAVSHSQMGDAERHAAWAGCRSGRVKVLVGTRSAVFADLPDLALVVVDEEHDPSYKQQEGLRYSARDLAIVRARDRQVPVVLGSATPSLESLHNAASGRSTRLRLRERPGSASQARLHLLDIRGLRLEAGLSAPLLKTIGDHLAAGNQVLTFLNRRGFAPALMCHGCGWLAECRRCDSRMVLHREPAGLRCHHCDSRARPPQTCPDCGAGELAPLGQGTQRAEQELAARFPDVPVLRIDRDSVRTRAQLGARLDEVHRLAAAGAPALLVGTQMLAKGHHFPAVTLVAVVDADGGLFSADFRGPERMAQTLVQVAGRAGRAERPGEVLVQTHHPDHPVVVTLAEQGYHAFAAAELADRAAAGWPPQRHLALLRAEAQSRGPAEALLAALADHLGQPQGLELLGPVPAPMERRGGRWRAQLLLLASERRTLHRALSSLVSAAEGHPLARRARWSLDVDPADTL